MILHLNEGVYQGAPRNGWIGVEFVWHALMHLLCKGHRDTPP